MKRTVLLKRAALPQDGFDELGKEHIISAETCQVGVTAAGSNPFNQSWLLHDQDQPSSP